MLTTNEWTEADIPDQAGKITVVTGANIGLGYETVKALALKHAQVILACRDIEKGNTARDQVHHSVPDALIEVVRLDLASMDSIRQFAGAFKANHDQLHILVNNAGVMATPRYTTADGFELQFGTNHLGHFVLTGLLLDVLLKTHLSRVVTVSSLAERFVPINFNDLMGEKSYNRWTAYCQSKLANLLFAYELQRRLKSAGAATISLAAHPGFAATNLRAKLRAQGTPLFHRITGFVFDWVSQASAEKGALPQLYAATAPGVQGCDYYGPDGFFQTSGFPRRLSSSRRSYDGALANRLWKASEELTGVKFNGLKQ